MKVYLAGPMTGIPFFNFPTFMSAAKALRDAGHEVFNPAENDIKTIGRDFSVDYPTGDAAQLAKDTGFTLRKALADDLNFICLHAEAIALLPGWENSKGVRAELATAQALKLQIIEMNEVDNDAANGPEATQGMPDSGGVS